MKQLLFSTDNSYAGLLLRLSLGLIMFPHGAQKLVGWFGGYGFKNTMDYFIHTMKLSWPIAFLIIMIEFFAPVFLVFGFATKLSAILLAVIMVGAIITTNYQHGFFMNWFGNQNGEGFEYHLLVIAICLALLFSGSGKFSIDALIIR